MKKTVALLVVFLMLLTALASCTSGGNGGTSKGTSDGNGETSSDKNTSETEEDPNDGITVMTVGSFEVSRALYRYYFSAHKAMMLEEDPTVFETDEKAMDTLKEKVAESCKEIAVYYNLYAELGKTLPKDLDAQFDKDIGDMNSYYSMYYGISFEDYLKSVGMSKTGYKSMYCIEKFISSELTEVLGAKDGGYGDWSEEAIAEVSKDYVSVKHILVGYNDGLSDEEALSLANSLIERINGGESIDGLMEEYSNDYHKDSSNIYTFTYGEMVEAFEKTAFAMEDNQLSEPVKSQFGYHIILKLPLDDSFYTDIYQPIAAENYIQSRVAEQTVSYTDAYAELLETLK